MRALLCQHAHLGFALRHAYPRSAVYLLSVFSALSVLSVLPVNPRDRSAQRCPPALVRGEGDGFLIVGDEMRAEDGANTGCLAGALELDGAVDAVRVGAGERAELSLGRRLRERLRARGADPEGEVRVDVEMGEHREG